MHENQQRQNMYVLFMGHATHELQQMANGIQTWQIQGLKGIGVAVRGMQGLLEHATLERGAAQAFPSQTILHLHTTITTTGTLWMQLCKLSRCRCNTICACA